MRYPLTMFRRLLKSAPWALLYTIALGLAATTALAEDISDEEAERLFNDDWEQRAAAVNEGKLEFLREEPAAAVHHHFISLIVTRDSVQSGWVAMRQCHEHLDPVPDLEIVFNTQRIRDLAVESFVNMENAWVQGAAVRLRNVSAHARVCITGRSRALEKEGDDYVLRNGPFMRKFLDGYYPMRVSIDVSFPETYLRLLRVEPATQSGWEMVATASDLHLRALFSGRLRTAVYFQPVLR